jgi:hypothetical protein
VLPFVLAAGTAGGSVWLAKLRPYLLAASALFVAFGFYQAWRAKQCNCKPRLANTLLLWFAAVVVVVSILFPEVVANALAGSSGGHETPSGKPDLLSLNTGNFSVLKDRFNSGPRPVRVIAMLSPT